MKVFRLEQLDEEIRVALGELARRGVSQDSPDVAPRALGDPLSDVQAPLVAAAIAAHVPNPLFGERQDIRICRLYEALAAGTATPAQTQAALSALIRVVRAIAS